MKRLMKISCIGILTADSLLGNGKRKGVKAKTPKVLKIFFPSEFKFILPK